MAKGHVAPPLDQPAAGPSPLAVLGRIRGSSNYQARKAAGDTADTQLQPASPHLTNTSWLSGLPCTYSRTWTLCGSSWVDITKRVVLGEKLP